MRKSLKTRTTNQLFSVCQSLFLTLAVGSFLSGALINPVMAQQEEGMRTLSVTGTGEERIPATLAQVSLGVEIQGNKAAEVQQEVAQRTSAVVEFLRERDVERLQTQGISLRQNYSYNDNQRRLIGYIGTNTVSFRVPTDSVGELLDRVVEVGATRIDRVDFTATEAEIASAQKEALRKATVEAQQQADAVLAALNFTSQEIVGIRVNGANLPQPRRMVQRNELESAAVARSTTPVIAGEQTVRSSVTLQIRY